MSLHPPHLIDPSGSLTPAALIPFCAYQTNMTLLGQNRQDLPFTVCSKFQPTVLKEQLCYSLDLSMTDTPKTNAGLENGLLIILDPGMSRQAQKKQEIIGKLNNRIGNKINLGKTVSMNLNHLSDENRRGQIYLNTLSSFNGNKNGHYTMDSLKWMAGTGSFNQLPDKVKKCMSEDFEKCQRKEYTRDSQNCHKVIPLTSVSQSVSQSYLGHIQSYLGKIQSF